MELSGTTEWSNEELLEKEEAMQAVSRPFARIVAGSIEDEFQIIDDNASDLANTSFETSALNQILAWLNFPYKLRPYLDALIGLAGSSEQSEFSAINIEIARQIRTGKTGTSDASMQKWVTRQKKQFQIWQSVNNFHLVKIEDGFFNAKQQKNTPSKYTVFIVEWVKIAVSAAKAKNYWRNDKTFRRFQNRAIRRACYDVLQSLPEAPPLRLKIRTLSEEEKLDRRVHLQISAHERNLDFIDKLGMATEELHQFVLRELNKAYEKKRGIVGDILTANKNLPDKKASVFHKLKIGTLLEEVEDLTEDIKPKKPKYWANGGWIETSNSMPEQTASEEVYRTDIESDNIERFTETACNPLNLKSVGGTFLPENEKNKEAISEVEKVQKVVSDWLKQVAEKIPDAPPSQLQKGVWQFYRYEVFTEAGRRAESALEETVLQVASGAIGFEDLKESAVDYVMTRVTYWKNGVPVPVDQSKLSSFRTRLEEFLQIPEDLDDG